ncbi:MAG: AAA family ATPase [Ardenticatenaceae bacterium]
MAKPVVILVTGIPGTGKTTLGRHLARRFNLPYLHKDGFKETLYDAVGSVDYELSRKLGYGSMMLLYHVAEALLATGQSFVVEANFDPRLATREWLDVKQQYDFEPLQIQCVTQGEELLRRFITRASSGERHPSHPDHTYYESNQAALLAGRTENLAIGGQVVELDTTDFGRIAYASLYEAVANILKKGQTS